MASHFYDVPEGLCLDKAKLSQCLLVIQLWGVEAAALPLGLTRSGANTSKV